MSCRSVSGRRAARGRSALDPGPDLVVDRGVVEQVEMRQAAEAPAVLDGEADLAPATLARGAGHAYEQVSEDGAERVARAPAEGRGDEVEARAGQERHVVAAVGEQLVGVAVAPVLLDARPVAQVLD